MLLNKILIFLHKLKGADYHTVDVTINYGNKITKHKTVKKFEIEPIHNGVWVSMTDTNGITESYALYDEFDVNWKIEVELNYEYKDLENFILSSSFEKFLIDDEEKFIILCQKSKKEVSQQTTEDNNYDELLKRIQELEDRVEWLEFGKIRC